MDISPFPSHDLAGLSGGPLVPEPATCGSPTPETSRFFFLQNFSPRRRLRLRDSRMPPLDLRGVPRSSVSLLAIRVMTGAGSDFDAPFTGGGGGVLGSACASPPGDNRLFAPSRSLGQLPGAMNGSSVAAMLARWPGGVGWSSSVVTEEGCVDNDGEACDVAAVAELVACDRDDGKEFRVGAVCFALLGTLCRLALVDFEGDPRMPGEDGEPCLPGVT